GTAGPGLCRGALNQLSISVEIPHDWIELGDGDLHTSGSKSASGQKGANDMQYRAVHSTVCRRMKAFWYAKALLFSSKTLKAIF
ncbi:MAG TPA: hypothetical protein VNQ76_14410, partial [Planctomicrobium sp.]|nr:hypothetical protein [Planctomicrobium sp.]